MNEYKIKTQFKMRTSKVIEMTSAMLSIISPRNESYNIAKDVYGDDFIQSIVDKYSYILKILDNLSMKGYEILEFLLINHEFDDILKYESHIRSLDDLEFFNYFFGGYIPRDSLEGVIDNTLSLKAFYNQYGFCCSNIETLKYIIFEKEIFLTLLFNCIKEFDTNTLDDTIEQIDYLYEEFFKRLLLDLESNHPLKASENLLGKTFKNRGPYKNFVFIPVFFLPTKAVRYFGENQILLYKVMESNEILDNKLKLLECLKVISDPTRFEIIQLLQNNEPMFGKQIAEYMSLSTPTISHHLDQLKNVGFINEERHKNSKYFSANINSLNEFIDLLTKTLNKKNLL